MHSMLVLDCMPQVLAALNVAREHDAATRASSASTADVGVAPV